MCVGVWRLIFSALRAVHGAETHYTNRVRAETPKGQFGCEIVQIYWKIVGSEQIMGKILSVVVCCPGTLFTHLLPSIPT